MTDKWERSLNDFTVGKLTGVIAVDGEGIMGGLEVGAQCSPGEKKGFSRKYAPPEGHKFIAAGISDEYEGTAVTTIGPDGAYVIVGSNCTGGQIAKYRWWARYNLVKLGQPGSA